MALSSKVFGKTIEPLREDDLDADAEQTVLAEEDEAAEEEAKAEKGGEVAPEVDAPKIADGENADDASLSSPPPTAQNSTPPWFIDLFLFLASSKKDFFDDPFSRNIYRSNKTGEVYGPYKSPKALLTAFLVRCAKEGIPEAAVIQACISERFKDSTSAIHTWCRENLTCQDDLKKRIAAAKEVAAKIAEDDDEDRPSAGAMPTSNGNGITIFDFYAYLPQHLYIFAPTGEMWAGDSVNAILLPQLLLKKDGTPVLVKGKRKLLPASAWLDQNRPVEQMTWAPGLPEIIEDRLLYEGGWRRGTGPVLQPIPRAGDHPGRRSPRRSLARPCAPRLPRRGRASPLLAGASGPAARTRRSTTRSCSAASRASARTRCWSR